nr:formin-like protein 20 [Aegilops tauschii subsp. strangulata]
MEDDEEWMSIDATLIRWFYTTISKDLFHTVVSADDDAHAVWTKLNGLFTDNVLQRKVFLHGEFFGCQQLDTSVDDYCMRLKKLVDELRDLGEKVSDELLLSTLIAGLNDDFGNAASNIPLITNPTFPKIVVYLKLEERRMRMSRTRATHTALTAGTRGGAPPTAPPRPVPGPFPAPPPPGFPYPQQPPAPCRAAAALPRGGRKPQQQQQPAAPGGAPCHHHQLAAPTGALAGRPEPLDRGCARPYPPVPLYGPSAAYGLPSAGGFVAPPPQPAPSAPALPPAPWDPALLAALHTAPTPQQYTGGGDWYMDTGATAHMVANPGCPYPDGAPPM